MTNETVTIKYGQLVTLGQFAELHELPNDWRKRARRAARNARKTGETVGDIVNVLGNWAIPHDAPVPELPEPRARGVSRDDGRAPWRVYATTDEIAAIRAMLPDDCVIDPRVKRAERRAAKRAARDEMDNDNA